MNLDPSSAASSLAPLAPPEWTMQVQLQGLQFTAVVQRAGTVMCRLSLVRPDANEPAARRMLADKARFWIQDYLQRSGSP